MLRLSDAGRLPTLANQCFIVGGAKRADVIWSEGDFKALCEHMLNDNPPDYFLSAWIDKASAQPRFAKAQRWSRADKRASWAWATITGKAKVQTAVGFYPSNVEQKSRWSAIDFDAHNGDHEQARKRAPAHRHAPRDTTGCEIAVPQARVRSSIPRMKRSTVMSLSLSAWCA